MPDRPTPVPIPAQPVAAPVAPPPQRTLSVLGGIALAYAGLTVAGVLLLLADAERRAADTVQYGVLALPVLLAQLALAVLLGIAGVGLLRRRTGARRLGVIYGWCGLALAVVTAFMQMRHPDLQPGVVAAAAHHAANLTAAVTAFSAAALVPAVLLLGLRVGARPAVSRSAA